MKKLSTLVTHTFQVLGKGKVMLKLTLGKILALNEVLRVPNIKANFIYVSLLGKVGVKVQFESNKIVITENNVFVGKGYCSQRLFVLNVAKITSGHAFSSAYLIDSYDIWHTRLRHVSS